MTRTSNPKQCMAYPHLPDDAWVVWHGNAHVWPDARRETRYLSVDRRDILKGYALMTTDPRNAAVFPGEEEARAFLAEHEALRGRPYHDIQVSTVEEMKRARGYAPEQRVEQVAEESPSP